MHIPSQANSILQLKKQSQIQLEEVLLQLTKQHEQAQSQVIKSLQNQGSAKVAQEREVQYMKDNMCKV